MILVVGATGQLGTVVVRKLEERGKSVRALVRKTSNYQHLVRDGNELVFGDLRNAASLDAACQNIDTVIATANAAVPREEGDSFKAVDDQGYENLINACRQQGVRQFVCIDSEFYFAIAIGITQYSEYVRRFLFSRSRY